MTLQQQIADFLAGEPFAVVGASADRAKYGNKVLRCYLQHGRRALVVNSRFDAGALVEGEPNFQRLADLPEKPHGVSIITPHPVTERIVEEAGKLGLRRLWMQPGAESPAAIARAKELGMSVIAGGPCVLVALGYDDSWEPE